MTIGSEQDYLSSKVVLELRRLQTTMKRYVWSRLIAPRLRRQGSKGQLLDYNYFPDVSAHYTSLIWKVFTIEPYNLLLLCSIPISRRSRSRFLRS